MLEIFCLSIWTCNKHYKSLEPNLFFPCNDLPSNRRAFVKAKSQNWTPVSQSLKQLSFVFVLFWESVSSSVSFLSLTFSSRTTLRLSSFLYHFTQLGWLNQKGTKWKLIAFSVRGISDIFFFRSSLRVSFEYLAGTYFGKQRIYATHEVFWMDGVQNKFQWNSKVIRYRFYIKW